MRRWPIPIRPPRGSTKDVHLINANGALDAVSPRDLQRALPNLYDEFRKSGNRIVDPVAKFDGEIRTFRDLDVRDTAWEWIQLRLDPQQRWFSQTSALFPNTQDAFAQLLQSARDQPFLMMQIVNEFLEIFEWVSIILSRHTGWEVGWRLRAEIFRVAQLFVPFVSFVDSFALFDFLDQMHRILGNRDFFFMNALELILNSMDLWQRDKIYNIALQEARQGVILGRKIVDILEGNSPFTNQDSYYAWKY